MKAFYEKYQVCLTRRNLELIAVTIMVISAISVFTTGIPGKGVLKLDGDKIVYDGSLVRGKMNGQGTLTFDNGDKYVGNFRNGSFNGQGTFTSAKGWKYEGTFANGQPEGKGKLTTQSNVIYEGTFKQGIYQHAN